MENKSTFHRVKMVFGLIVILAGVLSSLLPSLSIGKVLAGGRAGSNNNVEYDGLAHDSRSSLYRVPSGTVTPGTTVLLRLRTFHDDVDFVVARIWDTSIARENKQPLTLVATDVDCYDAGLTSAGRTCDYWQLAYTPQALGTVYYRFIITDGSAVAYYSDNASRYGGLGLATKDEVDNGFRLNVDSPAFPVIGWMQSGVMYQIFPDRFRNGSSANDPTPTDPRYDYPAPSNATAQQTQAAADAQIMVKKWNELPEGFCRDYANLTLACSETPKGRDYFGGDLKGVDDKLDYLKSLGVTIIYFNPIFESGSNHGYDTRDFQAISHYLGTLPVFKKLITDANARGIRILLDGVFNHLSSDSPFFDRYHHYTTTGACEDISSPYRAWFVFHDVTPGKGVCVDNQNRPNAATYDGWAGFDSIPVIVKQDPAHASAPFAPVAAYFYANDLASVANRWLNLGISGWRFDVMTDPSFPSTYWQQLRAATKGIRPDETLIAEAWQWFDNLPLTHGDQADTAMGYRFRNAVLGLLGGVDNKGFPEETHANLPPSTFVKRMDSIREDYADATYTTFQNLLDSHDTKRILWSLTPGQNNREDKELNPANLAIGKAKEALAALIQMTVPGTPTIYYGDEVSLTGSDDPDDRRAFPWNLNADGSYAPDVKDTPYFGAGGDHATLDWYRGLTALRKANPVFSQGKLTFLLADDKNQALSYAMRKNNNLAIVVINRNETAAQTIKVPTAAYLRDGVALKDALGGASATTQNGSLTISLGALKAAILIMQPVQDITGPAAPAGLTTKMTNGTKSSVRLSWNGSAGSARYNIYRSPVQGGGYVTIGSTSQKSFVDANLANGKTYHYLVRGLDRLGNEGESSAEASATPALPIVSASLQSPTSITQVISSNYSSVIGRVSIPGITDRGPLWAQVGLGAAGSSPSAWRWSDDMEFNPSHSGDGNFEFTGHIRADAPGAYQYLVRFSDDGGLTWVYGDLDGFGPDNSGTNKPGVMLITPSKDKTAPSTPIVSIDYSATSLTLDWTVSTDEDGAQEYRVFRGTAPGREGALAVATVQASVLSLVDTEVMPGQTYYYQVRAYDGSLNASLPSKEVSHMVQAKTVQVTFRVKVPAFLMPGQSVYLAGQTQGVTPDPLCGYCGGSPATKMKETAPGSNLWELTLSIPDGVPIQYKYTRGTYDSVEEWGTIAGYTNRVAKVSAASPVAMTQLIDDTSDTATDDNHKAVQNWRDTLVASSTPADGAAGPAPKGIRVTFNWEIKPEGQDFNQSMVVTKDGAALAGTTIQDSNPHRLLFTPKTPFGPGSYTVTVDHVAPITQQNDGIKIGVPYAFTFTVN